MKKAFTESLFFALFLVPTILNAQKLAVEICNKYPASIVARVYDVTSKTKLPLNKQLLVASCFQTEDSLIKTAIQKEEDATAIDIIRNTFEKKFRAILSVYELNRYYAKEDETAKIEAKITVALLQKKYECDTTTNIILYNLLYNKHLESDKVFREFPDTANLTKQLTTVINKYDSSIEKFVYAASSYSFLKKHIAKLDSIQLLTPIKRKTIERFFLNLCVKPNELSFADNFNVVIHKVLTDTIYFATLYNSEITRQATSNTKQDANDLIKNKGVTKDGMKIIAPLLFQKERSLLAINYSFLSYTRTKDSLLHKSNHYYDSMINMALMHDGYFKIQSKFSTAVQYRQILQLSAAQIDSLLSKAMQLEKNDSVFSAKEREFNLNLKVFESIQLPTILNAAQYTQLLNIINHDLALKWAKSDWEELQQRKLATSVVNI